MNFRQIDSIIKTCQGRIDRVGFLRQIPHTSAIEPLTTSQWKEVLEYFLLEWRLHGEEFERFVNVRDTLWATLFCDTPYQCGFTRSQPRAVIVECNGNIHICRKANVLPCVEMPDIVAGSLKDQSLEEIWEHSPALSIFRNKKNFECPECRQCES